MLFQVLRWLMAVPSYALFCGQFRRKNGRTEEFITFQGCGRGHQGRLERLESQNVSCILTNFSIAPVDSGAQELGVIHLPPLNRKTKKTQSFPSLQPLLVPTTNLVEQPIFSRRALLFLCFFSDSVRYSYLTKVEPTLRALQQLAPGGWITGRRRSQGELRSHLPVVENDAGKLGRIEATTPMGSSCARWFGIAMVSFPFGFIVV